MSAGAAAGRQRDLQRRALGRTGRRERLAHVEHALGAEHRRDAQARAGVDAGARVGRAAIELADRRGGGRGGAGRAGAADEGAVGLLERLVELHLEGLGELIDEQALHRRDVHAGAERAARRPGRGDDDVVGVDALGWRERAQGAAGLGAADVRDAQGEQLVPVGIDGERDVDVELIGDGRCAAGVEVDAAGDVAAAEEQAERRAAVGGGDEDLPGLHLRGDDRLNEVRRGRSQLERGELNVHDLGEDPARRTCRPCGHRRSRCSRSSPGPRR